MPVTTVPSAKIGRIVVLMLENRSFDHMLGFAGLRGFTPDGAATTANGLTRTEAVMFDGRVFRVQRGAPFRMRKDPPHEFHDVRTQLCESGDYPSITMGGFARSNARVDTAEPGAGLKCFSPEQLPVLTTLAREFAVCDAWFSSLPGPTWPNRFFAHAGTAGRQYDSPTAAQVLQSEFIDGWDFKNGNLFDRLDKKKLPWRIYHGSALPQVFALDGMTWDRLSGKARRFSAFAQDIASKNFKPQYVFIEPDYGDVLPPRADFTGGDSQHPIDDVRSGEKLIKTVYEAVRQSPWWEQTLLIITYDEHGGFYDHVTPPTAVRPGDETLAPGELGKNGNFQFDRYGVRVPTVVISPWIERGVIDHTLYDHASVPATVERQFGLAAMTVRDRQANDVLSLLTRAVARTDAVRTLPTPPAEARLVKARMMARQVSPADEPVSPMQIAFAHLALKRRLERSRTPTAKQTLKEEFANLRTTRAAAAFVATAVQPTTGNSLSVQARERTKKNKEMKQQRSAARIESRSPAAQVPKRTSARLAPSGRTRFEVQLAQAIAAKRKAAGLTPAALAKLAGLPAIDIIRLESGDTTGVSLATLRRISEALGGRLEVNIVTTGTRQGRGVSIVPGRSRTRLER